MEISKVNEIKNLEEEKETTAAAAKPAEEVSILKNSSETPPAKDPISIYGDKTVTAPEDSVNIAKKKEEAKTEEKKEEKSLWQKATGWLFGSSEETETSKEKSKTEEKGLLAKLKDAIFGEDKPANKVEEKKEIAGFWTNLKDILFGDEADTQTADNASGTSATTSSHTSNTGATNQTTNIDLSKIKELEGKEIDRELVAKIQNSPSLSAEQKAELKEEIFNEMGRMGIDASEITEEKLNAFIRIMQFQNLDHKNVGERRARLRNEVTRENYKQFIANHPNLTDEQKKQLERQFNIDGILEKVALNRATQKCTAEEAAQVYLQASTDTEELRKASIEALADEMKKDGVEEDMRQAFVTASENTSRVVLKSVTAFKDSARCPDSFKDKLLASIKATEESIDKNSSELVQTLKERAQEDKAHYAEELKEITIKKEQQQEERKLSKTKLENAEWKIWLVTRKIYALICEITKKMGQSYTVKDQDLKALNPALFSEWQNALSFKETSYWEDYDIGAKGRLLDDRAEIVAMNFSSAATRAVILS